MVAEYREKYERLLKKSQEDVLALKTLRARVLSLEVVEKNLKDEVNEAMAATERRHQVAETCLDAFCTLVEAMAALLELELDPVQRSLLEPLRVAQTATWRDDWQAHQSELVAQLQQKMAEVAGQNAALPDKLAAAEAKAEAERARLTARFQEQMEALKVKLGRRDQLLEGLDGKLGGMASLEQSLAESTTARAELESQVERLKEKLSQQRDAIQRLSGELEEQKQLWCVLCVHAGLAGALSPTPQRTVSSRSQPLYSLLRCRLFA